MFKRSLVCAVAATSLALLVGCSKSEKSSASTETQAGAQAAPFDAAQAKEVFNARCAACHGPEGMGNGPGSVALNPKPRNYHDKAWQTKVTDEDIRKTITYGGAAVGKSPMMPANPDLESKPEVIEGLLRIVRGFGKS
jgi:mono/diheme cytochrome c family protein